MSDDTPDRCPHCDSERVHKVENSSVGITWYCPDCAWASTTALSIRNALALAGYRGVVDDGWRMVKDGEADEEPASLS